MKPREAVRDQLKEYFRYGPTDHFKPALGCSTRQLRTHIESKFKRGMTWANRGKVWHVDHIKPITAFDLTDPAQRMACNHYTNLQPLRARLNIAKGGVNRISKHGHKRARIAATPRLQA